MERSKRSGTALPDLTEITAADLVRFLLNAENLPDEASDDALLHALEGRGEPAADPRNHRQ